MANAPKKSDAKEATGADNAAGAAPSGGGKLSFKVILVVAVIMVLEAGVLLGVAMLTAKPTVKADSDFVTARQTEENALVEVPVFGGKLPNNKQGVLYLYDTKITLRVKHKDEERVTKFIEDNKALITTKIAELWRNAEPRYFDEPFLSTLTRQVSESLKEIMPTDPKSGESVVDGVLIESLTPYRAGF